MPQTRMGTGVFPSHAFLNAVLAALPHRPPAAQALPPRMWGTEDRGALARKIFVSGGDSAAGPRADAGGGEGGAGEAGGGASPGDGGIIGGDAAGTRLIRVQGGEETAAAEGGQAQAQDGDGQRAGPSILLLRFFPVSRFSLERSICSTRSR